MVNLLTKTGRDPQLRQRSGSRVRSGALWPTWALVPAALVAAAIGAFVASLTDVDPRETGAPAEVSDAIARDQTQQLTASDTPSALPPTDVGTLVAGPDDVPALAGRDPSPVANPDQPVEPRRDMPEAVAPSQAQSVTPTPPATSPSEEPDPSPPPDQTAARIEAPAAVARPRAPAPAGLRGTFRDPSGPVAGLIVKLVDQQSETVLETVTSDDGVHEFFPVPPAVYTVLFISGQETVYERPALSFAEAQMRTLGVTSPTPVSRDGGAPIGGR